MRRSRRTTRRSGFTLLEILIVVGIIALLAAFVVPQFSSTSEKAKRDIAGTMVASGGNLATQLEIYKTHVGSYPEELKFLTEKPEDEEQANKWAGPYITDPNSLKDPWGKDLQYKAPGQYNTDRYDLWSTGPDGQDGSDDDIGNWTKA